MSVRAKHQTYVDVENAKTFERWHPQVFFNGSWCFLPDENTKTKLKEAPDQIEALEMALQAHKALKGEKE